MNPATNCSQDAIKCGQLIIRDAHIKQMHVY